jgi:hypothetical protein
LLGGHCQRGMATMNSWKAELESHKPTCCLGMLKSGLGSDIHPGCTRDQQFGWCLQPSNCEPRPVEAHGWPAQTKDTGQVLKVGDESGGQAQMFWCSVQQPSCERCVPRAHPPSLASLMLCPLKPDASRQASGKASQGNQL